jgi:putative phosphoribosyl transferase
MRVPGDAPVGVESPQVGTTGAQRPAGSGRTALAAGLRARQHDAVRFDDRVDAGRRLARVLEAALDPAADIVVLGLPRGGVPVAREVARVLGAPLDVILVRKLGLPAQPELAMGAIGEDGVRVVNDSVVAVGGVSETQFAAVEARERAELQRRATRLRAVREREPLDGRVAVIVDDGIATGSTARAAAQVARAHGAARVVVAAPVAPPPTVHELGGFADEVVVVESPERFFAIGEFYRDFSPTSEDEVVALLAGG